MYNEFTIPGYVRILIIFPHYHHHNFADGSSLIAAMRIELNNVTGIKKSYVDVSRMFCFIESQREKKSTMTKCNLLADNSTSMT